MNKEVLIVFGIISLLVGIGFISYTINICKKKGRTKRLLSSVQLYTVGIFLSLLLILIPFYYTSYDFGDKYNYIRPFLLSVYSTLRIFILDGDYEFVLDSLSNESDAVRVCLSLYIMALYVIAPILTFSNVLSLFKNMRGEIRYRLSNKSKYYIMSKLNDKSVALAKSVCGEEDSVIVFTDVFAKDEEDDYELLTEVMDLNAICLKKDIRHLDIYSKKGDVEIFLIGDDESENVNQAVSITTELNEKNTKQNVKVFVFSQSESSAYIIDSIKYDNLLTYAGQQGYDESCFKLRRINEKQQLIWNTLPKMKLFELAEKNDRTLSVLIVGFGSYGMEFFKTLIWFCQFEGYKLQINIVDKQGETEEHKSRVESIIDRHCPDLMKTRCSNVDGDAWYDIEIIPGIDMETSDFADLVKYEGLNIKRKLLSDRIRKTNLAFVSLGNDDLNIEVAVHLRSLFDQVNGVKAKKSMDWTDEAVDIYSVVFDEQKSGILHQDGHDSSDTNYLLNHKDVPYHIHFIGEMSTQFHYNNIYDDSLEQKAYEHHSGWVDIEEKIYREWVAADDQVNLNNHEWYFEGEKTDEAIAEARKKYEKYEYYRLSSMAKELYQREIRNTPILAEQAVCCEGNGLQTCKCVNCIRRKRSEHMRWNAYTRVMGYSYHKGVRADRAKLHDNLCGWDALSELDRQKD